MKNKANSQRFKRVYSWLNFMKLLQNCSEFVKNLQKPAKSMSIIRISYLACRMSPVESMFIRVHWWFHLKKQACPERSRMEPICRRGIRGGRSICKTDTMIR